jgi:NAD(P)-dependent dehydrogenase (short-subunit alcohol dehydrogenase family)
VWGSVDSPFSEFCFEDNQKEEPTMTEKLLDGKNALVTGAYRNLGAVTAETLATYGANVIINDLDTPELAADGEKLLERIRAHGVKAARFPANMTKSKEVSQLCEKAVTTLGKIDVVVNNVGPFNMDPYVELKEEMWDLVMDANLKAIYLTTQTLAPQMKTNGWGRIVNMCAGSAFIRNHSVYTLAKAGVKIITEELALELGPEITVNAIAPGQIYESLPDIHEFDPTFGDRYTARAPAKRLVTRREIAHIIALVCTTPFDTMTGMTLRIDGGAEIPRF